MRRSSTRWHGASRLRGVATSSRCGRREIRTSNRRARRSIWASRAVRAGGRLWQMNQDASANCDMRTTVELRSSTSWRRSLRRARYSGRAGGWSGFESTRSGRLQRYLQRRRRPRADAPGGGRGVGHRDVAEASGPDDGPRRMVDSGPPLGLSPRTRGAPGSGGWNAYLPWRDRSRHSSSVGDDGRAECRGGRLLREGGSRVALTGDRRFVRELEARIEVAARAGHVSGDLPLPSETPAIPRLRGCAWSDSTGSARSARLLPRRPQGQHWSYSIETTLDAEVRAASTSMTWPRASR